MNVLNEASPYGSSVLKMTTKLLLLLSSQAMGLDQLRESQRRYRASGKKTAACRSNPVSRQLSTMVSASKRRAKEKGLDHNIDLAYLRSITTSHCPYLGIELRWEVQNGLGVQSKVCPNSPSLDRIDSSKGYIKGNVVIVSHRANSIKRDATEVELIEMGRRIAELKMQLILDEE